VTPSIFNPREVIAQLHRYPAAATSLEDVPADVAAVHVTTETRALERLSELPRLRYLYASQLRAADFAAICRAPQVTHLSANVAEVRSLEPVGALTNLVALMLHQNTKVPSLYGIEQLKKLQLLSLANFAVTVDLTPLSSCRDLRFIWLSGTTWTPMRVPSLAPLAPLSSLGWLTMSGVRVKDRSLKPLHSLKSLSEVRLTNFPDSELFALAKALPDYDGRLLYSETAHRTWQRKLNEKIRDRAF